MNEREFLKDKKETGSLEFRKICSIVWHLKYWLLLSTVLCLSAAYFYIRYTTPIYQKSISVLLSNQQDQYSNSYQMTSNVLGLIPNPQIDNQIFVLKSVKLMRRVVERGDFNTRYFSVGRFIEVELYTDSPLIFSFIPEEGHENAFVDMTVTFTTEGKVHVAALSINGEPVALKSNFVNLEQAIITPKGSFNFTARGNTDIKKLKCRLHITRTGIDASAGALASNLTVFPANKQSDVLIINLRDRNPKRAEDVLNLLTVEYNALSKLYDSQSILNTISFLDERLEGLESELNRVEGTFTHYRSANELLDIKSQSMMVVNSDMEYKARLNELSLQISVLDIVKDYLRDDETHRLIPANIGISDGALNSAIEQYNQLVIDRDRMLAGSSDSNPRVQNTTNLLNTLKDNIVQSVKNLEIAYGLQQQSITKQLGFNQIELTAMPSKQLALTRMSRLQQVKEPLYILLQQKREEALLMLSSLFDHAQVVDAASGSNAPVSPRKKSIYILALIIGLAVPSGFVVLLNIFRSKILFEKDIVERCDILVLGVVPKALPNKKSAMKVLPVTETGRDPLTESFRMLRSKFKHLNIGQSKPGAFILQITSAGPDEGKSFISINMALSLAYLGKKVLLVGTDLRKPTVGRYLGLKQPSPGLSDFLSGNIEDIRQVITPYKDCNLLDIIPAGHIPLNPGELLSRPILGETLDSLRSDYDYIIVDSAPFLVVSDGFVVSKLVDSVLFVVRSGFTKLATLDTLQNMYREGDFKSIMIVLNAVDFTKNSLFGAASQGYGYGYAYGYGAGYGKGYGYVSDGKAESRSKKK